MGKPPVGAEIAAFELRPRFRKLSIYPSAITGRYGTSRDLGNCAGLTVTQRTEQTYRRHSPPFPYGGDSWALPTTIMWAEASRGVAFDGATIGITWNDFSNMNAGFFAGQSGHRDGRTIDGLFATYADLGRREAKILLAWLNMHSDRIERVYVGFSTNSTCTATVPIDAATNAFYQEIAGKRLTDDRLATSVILNRREHCDHFDVGLKRIVQ